MVVLLPLHAVIRWTIPRFRFDQLMGLAWKVMIPLALVNLVCVMVVKQFGWPLIVLTGHFRAAVRRGRMGFVSWRSVTNPMRRSEATAAGAGRRDVRELTMHGGPG